MPIHPDMRNLYPSDWPAISASIRERAGHRCEECNVPDRAWGFRSLDGSFHQLAVSDVEKAAFLARHKLAPGRRPPFRISQAPFGTWIHVIEIVLTVAHLDHRPENNAPDNLRCLCQRDHLAYDRPHHRATRAARLRSAMGTADLPFPPARNEA